MFKDITFGQFYPADSFVHKMDPRSKILLSVFYIVSIFFVQSFAEFGFVALFLLISIFAAKIPLRSVLKSLKPIMFLVVFTCILNIFFITDGETLVHWWIFRITTGGLIFAGKMALRLMLIVMGASMLTLTTTPVTLTNGIESLMKPLALVKFPVHEFALIMSIALRFIPTLTEETDRIIRAQKARGADFDTGNIFRRAKAFIPILIPLLISAFRRADELSLAMDSRCYSGSKGRTKMKVLKLGWRDFVGGFITVAVFVTVFLVNFFMGELQPILPWLFV